MANAKDFSSPVYQKILILGGAGSGKTTQIRTLPGRKFAYLFDPAALASLSGADIEYEEFLPDALEMDASIKGFNKGSKSDRAPSEREPTIYMDWVKDINDKSESGFFKDFQWLCFDSLSLLANAVMDRQMYLNNRYGGIEDLADYRIVGKKIADVFRSICSLPINIYCTGHISSFQDEKTKKIEYQIQLPGSARNALPLLFSNIWMALPTIDDKGVYGLRTRPEPRGFQSIRCTLRGIEPIIDVTIKDFDRAENYGIGKLLSDARKQKPVQAATTATAPAAKPAATTLPARGTPTPVPPAVGLKPAQPKPGAVVGQKPATVSTAKPSSPPAPLAEAVETVASFPSPASPEPELPEGETRTVPVTS